MLPLHHADMFYLGGLGVVGILGGLGVLGPGCPGIYFPVVWILI